MNAEMSSSTELFIGICGGSASGKTTVCNDLAKYFDGEVQIISQDSYYIDRSALSKEEIKKVNFDHPSSVDINQLYIDVLTLKENNEISVPQYCFKTHSVLKNKITVEKKNINIVEGLFVLESENLRNLFDMKIYIHADDDIRLIRRIKRDMEHRGRDFTSIIDQYLSSVKPMNEQYIVGQREYADIVIDTTNSTSGIDSLVAKIQEFIT